MCVTLSMLLWLLFPEGVTLAWLQDMTKRGLCLWTQLIASSASEPNTVRPKECDESTSASSLLDICTLILDFHQASGLKGQAVRHKLSKLCIFSHQSQWIFFLLTSASSGLLNSNSDHVDIAGSSHCCLNNMGITANKNKRYKIYNNRHLIVRDIIMLICYTLICTDMHAHLILGL